MTSIQMSTIKYALLSVLVCMLLWNNAVSAVGWFRETLCQEGLTNFCPGLYLDLCVYGASLKHPISSWDLYYLAMKNGVAWFRPFVEIFINKICALLTHLKSTSSLTEKLGFIVTSFLALFYPWKVVMLLWFILHPVRFGVNLTYWVIRKFIVKTVHFIMLPYRVFFLLRNKLVDKYHAYLAWKNAWMQWAKGFGGTTVTLDNGKVVKVSIAEKLDEILQLLRTTTGRLLESRQSGSDFMEVGQLPKGLVVVRSVNGTTVGMGFLVRAKGKLCLGTAAHVGQKIVDGFILSGNADNLACVQVRDIKPVLTTTLDFILLEVPENTSSILGIGKVKLGPTPSEGKVVNAYGFVNGRLCRSMGLTGSLARNFGFKHTASTLAGFSGTPLYHNDTIVAVHSRSDAMGYNYALSLDVFLNGINQTLEANVYENDFRAFRQTEEDFLEREDEDLYNEVAWKWESQAAVGARNSGKMWCTLTANESSHWASGAGIQSLDKWADETPMDFDDLGPVPSLSDFRPRFESAPGNFRRGSSHGAVSSTNGKGKEKETICESAVPSTIVNSVEPPKEALRKRKKKNSKRSKTGTGPTKAPVSSKTASTSIPVVSFEDHGSLMNSNEKESETKSSSATLEEAHQSGLRRGWKQELFHMKSVMNKLKLMPESEEVAITQKVVAAKIAELQNNLALSRKISTAFAQ